ncbi:hypothetical protein [Spirillospora sp. NPDC047279]|uniref:hypothetical protein n=1 Tax=Spirillospora sp. NPDC047279 TaxID=3155478 RepID=UPI0033DA54DC
MTSDVSLQLKSAQVLVELLSEDLPAAYWSIYRLERAQLDGQLVSSNSDDPEVAAAARAEIQRWADFLDVDVFQREHAEDATSLRAEGHYKRVLVSIFVVVPAENPRRRGFRRSR